MAENVGDLRFEIAVDGVRALKTLTEAKDRTDDLADSARKAGDRIRRDLVGEFGAFFRSMVPFASVTAAVASFTKAHGQLVDQMRMQKSYGIPVEEYAAWGRAAERLGYSAEDAQSALVALEKGMQDAALTGKSQVAGVLQYLGVRMVDASGKVRASTDILSDLSRVLSSMPVEKARKYGELMGFSPQTIAALREGKDLTAALSEALKNGPTEEDAEQAMQVQRAWQTLTQVGGDLARELLVMLYPAAEAVLKAMRFIVEVLSENPTVLAGALGLIGAKLLPLGGLIAGVTKAFKGLGFVLKANPIAAILSAIVFALSDLADWFNGESSVVGSVLEKLGINDQALNFVKEGIEWISSGLKSLMDKASAAYEWVVEKLQGIKSFSFFGDDDDDEEGSTAKRGQASGAPKAARRGSYGDDLEAVRARIRATQEAYSSAAQSALPQTIYQTVNTQADNRRTQINSDVHNEITINAGKGTDMTALRDATMQGVQQGMSGSRFNGLVAQYETGMPSL